jgi:hypothetical protein
LKAKALLSIGVISASMLIPQACEGDQGMRVEPMSTGPTVEQTTASATSDRSHSEPGAGQTISNPRLPERCLDRLPGPKPGYCDEVPEHARLSVY